MNGMALGMSRSYYGSGTAPTVVVRRCEWRRVRPWRVYYQDTHGRWIRQGNGYERREDAEAYAERVRQAIKAGRGLR